jgi:hypothetical protein
MELCSKTTGVPCPIVIRLSFRSFISRFYKKKEYIAMKKEIEEKKKVEVEVKVEEKKS